MAKDIKGVFQLFLQVKDNKKYKYNSNSDLADIFLSDGSIAKELDENRKILQKINNFELLIENVCICQAKNGPLISSKNGPLF